jgi:hypothetical protein
MRVRKSVALGAVVASVFFLAVAWWFAPRSGTLAISAGLDGYTMNRGQLRASIWLTNTGSAHVTIGLGYRCEVETPQGSTNYTAGVPNGWLWLRPRQGVILFSSGYLVPLPADARKWSFALPTRRQTSKERITSLLMRCGILDYREFNRHPIRYLLRSNSARERLNEGWEEVRSGWIDVPLECATRVK